MEGERGSAVNRAKTVRAQEGQKGDLSDSEGAQLTSIRIRITLTTAMDTKSMATDVL